MPSYTFLNKITQEETTLTMKMSELDDYKRDNPDQEQMLRTMNLADPTRVGVTSKPPQEFRDVLNAIKSKVPGNNINSF